MGEFYPFLKKDYDKLVHGCQLMEKVSIIVVLINLGMIPLKIFYTIQPETKGLLYAIITSCFGDGYNVVACTGYPTNGNVFLKTPTPSDTTTATLLGYGKVTWSGKSGQAGINVTLPSVQPPNLIYAWTVKLTDVN